MAHLPPKIPTNWSNFPHQRAPSMNSFLPATQPSWVEEFLDFSSAKRGSHRRSASDSVTFLETPLVEECRSSTSKPTNDFDRLDEEQLISMFSDDLAGTSPSMPPPRASPNSSENPSTPSDRDSVNEPSAAVADDDNNKNNSSKSASRQPSQQQLVGESEVQSACNSDNQVTVSADSNIDPKRVKRILANRQSAQRSRVRKLQYISELERSVTSLQTEVSALSPRVAFLDHQRLVLNVDNSALKQRIAALAQDKLFKDAHQEALKHEIDRLRHIYHQQNLKKINGSQEAS